MFILVRPPTDAQPMAEMPQSLINAPRGMMEDGAISDSPKTSTGGSRGLWHELAPRFVPGAGGAGKVVITSRQFPIQGLPRLPATGGGGGGEFRRLLPADPRLTRSCAARDGSVASTMGGSQHAE
ncbi:hypothetical protein IWW34DRAFT_416885 [Fusarium oxysporum f. sp. albedinis]|nr:hypothetical protein IWW34DRAFT_416885 [Fusarium oxysporum f. sp. albedinis]KAK2477144.1 hypothetical protein H9L39_12368 [Fusarium oxysporum f. sp. albedinis]